MGTSQTVPRSARRAGILGAIVLVWLAWAFWNFAKPMPAGTHVSSLPVRLAESQIEFIDDLPEGSDGTPDDTSGPGKILQRELDSIDRAEQLLILDQCPLTRELARHLLARKRQRPHLQIVLVTDPRNEVYGGTPAQWLTILEASGIIVARVRLDRLRDSNPLYSSFWRLGFGWWSHPFDEAPGEVTLTSTLRRLNSTADRRQLLAADDGAGGWTSIVTSGPTLNGGAGLQLRGYLVRDIIASELKIAAWSTDDDRLPPPPPVESRNVGTIDARFVTEGAMRAAVCEAIALVGRGDTIEVAVQELGDRSVVEALQGAAARGAHLQLLLDPGLVGNLAAADELVRDGSGNVDVRWLQAVANARFVLIRHGRDAWLDLGSADFTRRALEDLDLEAGIELRMPARAATAASASRAFLRRWSRAGPYAEHADAPQATDSRHRPAQVTGLAPFQAPLDGARGVRNDAGQCAVDRRFVGIDDGGQAIVSGRLQRVRIEGTQHAPIARVADPRRQVHVNDRCRGRGRVLCLEFGDLDLQPVAARERRGIGTHVAQARTRSKSL